MPLTCKTIRLNNQSCSEQSPNSQTFYRRFPFPHIYNIYQCTLRNQFKYTHQAILSQD
jgi:hypothetical protein